MLKIIIIEDDVVLAKDMRKSLQLNNCEVVGIAQNFLEAKSIFETMSPNFAFIDINLKEDKDGIDIANYFNEKCRIPFVFLTEHYNSKSPYFKRANAAKPAYYLPKGTYLPDQLWHFVEVALNQFANEGNVLIKEQEAGLFLRNQFFIKNKTLWEKINAEEITSIEVKNPYCKINILNRKGQYMVRQSLDNIIQLLRPFPLLRIHQSHAVNVNFIHQYRPAENKIVLSDKSSFEIGKTYRSSIKEKLQTIE